MWENTVKKWKAYIKKVHKVLQNNAWKDNSLES